MKACISADLFRIVAGFVSTEETRFYLRGVYVEPHPIMGVLLTATDGHRLFNAWDERGTATGSAIIGLPKDVLLACKSKMTGRDRGRAALLIDGDVVTVYNIESMRAEDCTPPDIVKCGEIVASAAGVEIDGTFPSWRRVLPTDFAKPGVAAAFPYEQLADFAKAAKALAALFGSADTAMSISAEGAGAPALVRFGCTSHAFAVQMPLRADMAALQRRPIYVDATPYPKPHVTIWPVEAQRIYFGKCEPTSWTFKLQVTLSPLGGGSCRTFSFKTKPEAVRAYNRVLAGLHARGLATERETIWPHYDLKPEALKAFEDRKLRIEEARAAFEAAEPIDLARPWQRASLKPALPSETWAAVGNLPALSEGRALASFYKAAA